MLLAGLAALPAVAPATVSAATIVVTSAADPGDAGTCTLRQAIVTMNDGATAGTGEGTCRAHADTSQAFGAYDAIGFDTGTFPSGGGNTITLAGSVLKVTDAGLAIDGSANGKVTIDAAALSPILVAGAPSGGSLTLTNLQLRNGQGTSCAAFGLGGGSGICVEYAGSTLFLDHSAVSNCTDGKYGGGILAFGDVILRDSTISGNHARVAGGGIYSAGGSVAVKYSTLSGNSAGDGLGTRSRGQGVDSYYYGEGGAIGSTQGNITLISSTLSDNTARYGAAIRVSKNMGPLSLTKVTVAGNHTTGEVITVFDGAHGGAVTFNGVIAAGTDKVIAAVMAPVTIAGSANLVHGQTSNVSFSVPPILGDPALGALGEHGGPTQTMLPGPGSAAIDAAGTCGGNDQRGVPRPQGSGCDIGAVEARQRQLAVIVTGDGSVSSQTPAVPPATNGIVDCPAGACSAEFAESATVSLVATPAADRHFVGWSGDCAADGTVTMSADKVCAAAFGIDPMPLLGLSVDDGLAYARYGQTLHYVIELSNTGDGAATNVVVTGSPGENFDAATLTWTCEASNGATCATGGSGTSLADTVTLPANSSLTWNVTIAVPPGAGGAAVAFAVDAGDASASDSDTLVLFRNGFD